MVILACRPRLACASFRPHATVASLAKNAQSYASTIPLSNNIFIGFCHSLFSGSDYQKVPATRIFLLILLLFSEIAAQTPPAELPDVSSQVFTRLDVQRSLSAGEVLVLATYKEMEGDWTHLQGAAELRAEGMILRADEIDYNRATGYTEARGNVYYENFERREKIWATRAEYFTREARGKFFDIRGETFPKIEARPNLYRTENPFHFEAKWAEREDGTYILHHGTLTNCVVPNSWWTLRGPEFRIVPGESARVKNGVLRIRGVPLFYAPLFYKSLKEGERKSGFLTPNAGNSNRRGQMFGAGYYWAISRSYDAMYRAQYFTTRGLAHQVDFRGKPTHNSDFSFALYGVADKGLPVNQTVAVADPANPGSTITTTRTIRQKASGFNIDAMGRTTLPQGFYARGELNYLSSFRFRQEFTESITEAIASEIQSIGFVAKDWSTFHLTTVFSRLQNFRTSESDTIAFRKLPEVRLASRTRRLRRTMPFYVAFDSSWGLQRRTQPLFQTRQFVTRMDVEPRIFAPLEWKGFHIVPSYSPRLTHYDSRLAEGDVRGDNLTRRSQEFGLEILPPSLSRVFDRKGLWGDKLKHVIEPRLAYRHVTGIHNFNDAIRFDTTELLSNTSEAEFTLTNRFFGKRGDHVEEVLSWELRHKRFFDPDFGGAVISGRRNVIDSSIDFSTFTFLNQPRRYSPIASTLRVSPVTRYGIQWRADYDPFYGQFLNSIVAADARFGDFFAILGHNRVRSTPLLLEPGAQISEERLRDVPSSQLLSPPANQFLTTLAWRDSLKQGWSLAFNNWYDFRTSSFVTSTAQATYNTDCCGFSVQYRRFGFANRSENQFRFSLTIANIGAFGTLRKQERLF